jgi:hypothetical protein
VYLNSLCPRDKVSYLITIPKAEEKIPQLPLEDIFSILFVSRQLPILKFPKQVLTQSLESADLRIHSHKYEDWFGK